MITGRKSGEARQGIRRAYGWVAAMLIAGVAALWVWYPAIDGGLTSAHAEHRHHEDG
jgi:hypothetical protein